MGCFCPSAAPRVASSSPAAQFAPWLSSSAARPWISSPSAGPSTATCCPTHRTLWSARCLDAHLSSCRVFLKNLSPHCVRTNLHVPKCIFTQLETFLLDSDQLYHQGCCKNEMHHDCKPHCTLLPIKHSWYIEKKVTQ